MVENLDSSHGTLKSSHNYWLNRPKYVLFERLHTGKTIPTLGANFGTKNLSQQLILKTHFGTP